uniref:Uncharacterized protein n=1 Tax=Cereibacter sphaeroides (strain ATCC 17025 / ATH 2.4.3) TaxID=349102 RepID=A4WXS0_CERS5
MPQGPRLCRSCHDEKYADQHRCRHDHRPGERQKDVLNLQRTLLVIGCRTPERGAGTPAFEPVAGERPDAAAARFAISGCLGSCPTYLNGS